MTAQSNQRYVRLLLRKRQPELAARLNAAVRTMSCKPGCRVHSVPQPPAWRYVPQSIDLPIPHQIHGFLTWVVIREAPGTGPEPAQDSPGQPSGT